MELSVAFLESLNERELSFFYTFRLPMLSIELQPPLKEYVLFKVSVNDIAMHLSQPNVPGYGNCRRCSSKKVVRNRLNERICTICGKQNPGSPIHRVAFYILDFFSQ